VLSRDPANAGRRLTPLPARRHACGMFTGLSGLVAPLFLGGQERKPVQTSEILAKLEPMEAKLDRLGQARAPLAGKDKTG